MAGPRYIGRYQVIEEVGRGGMGVVYRGVDPRLERTVAIKVLPPRKTASTKAIERFNREARVSARLDHPYIMKIFDVGEEDGTYFLVMEFVEGETLRDLIGEDTDPALLDVVEMARLFAQICQALEYAHALQITHRDIKPENIMVGPYVSAAGGRTVKVMDFGLAVLENRHDITMDNALMGTIAYLSPEQAMGEKADHRSDIYSLGVTFFEMLTGQLPFGGESPAELLNAHMRKPAPSPRSLNPAVSPLLERIVLGCMRKAPADRYASVADIRAELEHFRREADILPQLFWGPGGAISGAHRAAQQAPPPVRVPGTRDRVEAPVERRVQDLGREARRMEPGVTEMGEQRATDAVRYVPTASTPPALEVSSLSSPDTVGMPSDLAQHLGRVERTISRLGGESALQGPPARESGAPPLSPRRPAPELPSLAWDASNRQRTEPSGKPSNLPPPRGGSAAPPSSGVSRRVAPTRVDDVPPARERGGGGPPPRSMDPSPVASPEWARAAQQGAGEPDPWGRYQQVLSRLQRDEGAQVRSSLDIPSTLCSGCGQENPADRKFCQECGSLLTPSAFQAAREAATRLDKGRHLMQQGQWQDAVYELQQALLIDPHLGEAHKCLARIWLQRGERVKAEEDLRLCLTLHPVDAEAVTELALLLRTDGRKQEAVSILVEALRGLPEHVGLRCQLAFLYLNLGDTVRSVEEYRTAVAYDADCLDAHAQLGTLYASQNLVSDAILAFETVVRIDPGNQRAWQWLGHLHTRRQRFGEAERAYQQALELDAGDADVHAQLGVLYEQQRREDLAVRQLRQAIALEPGHLDSHLRLAALHLKHQQPAHAARQLEDALRYHPSEVRLHQQLGDLYLQANQLEKALGHFEKAVQMDTASSEQHKRLGQLYLKKDYYAESIAQFQKAVALDPHRPESHEDLGMAYFVAEQHDAAIQELKKAAILDARNVDYHKAVGVVCERQGRLEEAVQYLKRALELNPRDADAHGLLGRIYGRQKLLNLAVLEFQKALEYQPENQLMHIYLAHVYLELGRLDVAAGHFQKAIALIDGRDTSPELRRSLARSYQELARRHLDDGDLATAAEALESAVALDPEDARTQHSQGLLAQARGDLAGAFRFLSSALQREPQNGELLADLASLYLLRKEPELAVKAARKAQLAQPARAGGYLRLAESLLALGRDDEASEVLRQGLAAGVADVWRIHLMQGSMLLGQGRAQSAAGEFQQAVAADPWQWEPYRSLALAFEQLGRPMDAQAQIERAQRLPVKPGVQRLLQEELERLRLQRRR